MVAEATGRRAAPSACVASPMVDKDRAKTCPSWSERNGFMNFQWDRKKEGVSVAYMVQTSAFNGQRDCVVVRVRLTKVMVSGIV